MRVKIPPSKFDGNHVLMAGDEPTWKRQIKLIGAYASFYNPLNLLRALKDDGSPLRRRRIGYQLAGFAATVLTAVKTAPYLLRLLFTKPKFFTTAPPLATMPVRYPVQAFPRHPLDSPLIPVVHSSTESLTNREASVAA